MTDSTKASDSEDVSREGDGAAVVGKPVRIESDGRVFVGRRIGDIVIASVVPDPAERDIAD